MATEGVAMGQAVRMRTDYTAGEVRRLAKRAKDAAQARRLLAIAAVLDGASRTEAAEVGGMDRQTLRDWVIRFNAQGPAGLINIPSPGMPPKLDATHRAFLARIVEEGPIPAVHGVVRWRACDLIMRLHEEFGLSVSDDTIYRALKDLGYSHVSARPKAYKQDPEAIETFKKLCRPRGGNPRRARAGDPGRGVVPGRDAGRPEEQAHLPLGQEGLAAPRRPRSTHPVDLPVRCGLPSACTRRSPPITAI
jgi:putative transposase